MADPTIQQIIDGMPRRFNPDAAQGVDAVIQFRLTGDDGRDFHATIANRTCTLADGQHPNPTLTLKMSSRTYVDMVMGRLSGQQAFFTRKLTYSGPMNLVLRLGNFFTRPDETISAP